MTPSPQQQALFDLFLTGQRATGPRHVLVRARAGTGKTTSIVELVTRLLARWPALRIVCCAFGKEIALELQARLPRGAQAQTLHSLGLHAQHAVRAVRLDANRDARLAGQAVAPFGLVPKAVVQLVEKLAGLGKECRPLAAGPEELADLQADFDLLPDEEQAERYDAGWVRARAFEAMTAAAAYDGTCSYADMVYRAVRLGLARPTFDLVIVDEAQDMNPGQLLLALALVKAGGRVLVVGDDRQGIYRFRGADVGALDRLKVELGAVEVPLTFTRRCPKRVVALAQALVPDFQALADAPEGTVDALPAAQLTATARPGSFVLSRTNAPLVTACLRLVAAGVPARVRGRDLGKGLVALIRQAKAADLEGVEAFLERWAAKQLARAAKLTEARAERLALDVEDKLLALQALIDAVETVEGLVARIEEMFTDRKDLPAVLLSTVHRAKGLEAERVFVLEDTFRPSDDLEEANIRYVALTRAKSHLTLVRS